MLCFLPVNISSRDVSCQCSEEQQAVENKRFYCTKDVLKVSCGWTELQAVLLQWLDNNDNIKVYNTMISSKYYMSK